MKKYTCTLLAVLSINFAYSQISWKIDNGHSNIGFAIQWREISFRTGEFKKFEGEIVAKNEQDFIGASVSLKIDVGSIDVIAESLNKKMQTAEFLDSLNCPFITFTCSGMKKLKGKTYEAEGLLTIKCKSQMVKFIIEDNGRREKYAAIKVVGNLSKSNFGINGGGDRLGNLIVITSFFELVKKEQ